jgi:hypothetical protein
MKRLFVAVLIVSGVLASSIPAQAWTDSKWKSPSGNIWCYAPRWGVTCGTLNDGFTVALDWGGGRGYRLRDGSVYGFPAPRYTLAYGTTWKWRARGLVCLSSVRGMKCSSRWTGHGFFISRDSYNLW